MSEKAPLLFHKEGRKSGKIREVKPVLVIHGGAGAITREGSTPETQKLYKDALRRALRVGFRVLKDGGEAMDAAVAAVGVLEGAYPGPFLCCVRNMFITQTDCPLFNSGKGAVFNVAGKVSFSLARASDRAECIIRTSSNPR